MHHHHHELEPNAVHAFGTKYTWLLTRSRLGSPRLYLVDSIR